MRATHGCICKLNFYYVVSKNDRMVSTAIYVFNLYVKQLRWCVGADFCSDPTAGLLVAFAISSYFKCTNVQGTPATHFTCDNNMQPTLDRLQYDNATYCDKSAGSVTVAICYHV